MSHCVPGAEEHEHPSDSVGSHPFVHPTIRRAAVARQWPDSHDGFDSGG
jgi:hypothetical protein